MRLVVIFFVILLVGYVLAIQVWRPEITVAENQEANNTIRAEELVYESMPPVVMVGSSLIGGFHRYSTDDNIYFLPQSGGSAIEGLDVLRQVESVPDIVIIETNALYVERRPDFALAFADGPRAVLARNFVAFRARYRPTNLCLAFLHGIRHSSGRPAGGKKNVNAEALRARLAALKKMYAGEHEWQSYRENLKVVAERIDDLRGRGSQVMFIELPVHHELLASKFHRQRREQLMTLSEELDVRLVDLANPADAGFTDGIHYTDGTQATLVGQITGLAIGELPNRE